MRQRIIMVGLFLLALGSAASAQAAYPPYPDIWGYDISQYPAVKRGKRFSFVYQMDNGDVYFVVLKDFVEQRDANGQLQMKNKRYALIKFFAQETQEITGEELNTFGEQHQQQELTDPQTLMHLTLGEDARYVEISNRANESCSPNPLTNYMSIQNKEGMEIAGWVFLQLRDHPLVCDEGDGSGNITYKVASDTFSMVRLKDGTFIGFNDQLFVRFKSNFVTPYAPFNQRYTKISLKELEHLVKDVHDRQEQEDKMAAQLVRRVQ